MIRAVVIGCGLIGAKRAKAAGKEIQIASCCDLDEGRAHALARTVPGADASTDWQATVRRADIDLVFVATAHDMLATIAAEAAAAGKHVLIEKPGARTKAELAPVREAAARTGALVRVGFNHRYHRAFRKAREIFESGALGETMFVRGRYGHGGRPGYDREWRAAPEKSGGGELVDQGMHLIDLARWFLGDFSQVKGMIGTYFWDMPVEDNAFLLLRTAGGQVASLHATWTEWKNLFSFEIYGRWRQARNLGPGRKLWNRAAGLLPHAAGDGPARDHDLGVSRGRRFVAGGNRGVCRGHSFEAAAKAGDRRCRGGLGDRGIRLPGGAP